MYGLILVLTTPLIELYLKKQTGDCLLSTPEIFYIWKSGDFLTMRLLSLTLKTILGSFVTLSFIFIGYKSSTAQISCNTVASYGNYYRYNIVTILNNRMAGASYRYNRRKSLRINGVETISFSGCRMIARVNVTLKRKIRRDAHGIVGIQADITSLNLNNFQFCYDNARVTNVNLSNTLRIGESAYQWMANNLFSNSSCFIL